MPHIPQSLTFVSVSTQTPPQSVEPDGQVHTPPEQDVPPLQTLPHVPQLLESVLGSTQSEPH